MKQKDFLKLVCKKLKIEYTDKLSLITKEIFKKNNIDNLFYDNLTTLEHQAIMYDYLIEEFTINSFKKKLKIEDVNTDKILSYLVNNTVISF